MDGLFLRLDFLFKQSTKTFCRLYFFHLFEEEEMFRLFCSFVWRQFAFLYTFFCGFHLKLLIF